MKSMNDRSMKAKAGKPKSSAYFPEEAHSMEYGRAGSVNQDYYPDTEEEILKGQKKEVADIDRGRSKEGYRH